MIQIILWTLLGIPTGYIITELINDIYKKSYKRNISNNLKYCIITIIIFFAFLKGYTGKDFITNIYNNL